MEGDEGKVMELSGQENVQLHKVFVDLSLENDLKGEEMEWFRSRITRERTENKQKRQKSSLEHRKTEIITHEEWTKQTEIPNQFYLKLNETDTIWLLSLEPSLSENNLEDGEKVHRENETYKMKKTKKELIRKRCMADAQTPRRIEKSKGTLTTEIVLVNKYMFASEWDLYDTYTNLDKLMVAPSKKYLMDVEEGKSSKDSSAKVPLTEGDHDRRMGESFDLTNASLTMERLLASNCYQKEQSVFKKKFISRYYEGPTLFSYNIDPLWNFQKDFKQPLQVTDMDWNPLNKDLLAVGYGDLDFQKRSLGFICVWSPKNPRQPERQFEFNDSVTAVHYSKLRPNILAVGTRGGNVYVLDISSEVGNVRTLASDGWNTRPGPVWKVEWFLYKELIFETEELLAISESGLVMLFSMSTDKETTEIIKLDYVISRKKVFEKGFLKRVSRRVKIQDETFDKKTFAGLCFSLSSDRNFCHISTKEGVIVKCNLRNPSMRDEIFLGHDGPVFQIQHSPATDLVYFTCGADWSIKIWMKGIFQPLIILQHKTPVECARWSPTIPTLIASVAENELYLWDIARNILSPKASKKFEDCKKSFSTLLFTSNGMNIVIGSQDGLVHVVHLSELPRIPFLQKEALIGAINKALLKNQNKLLAKFSRAVEMNKEKLKPEIKL